MSRIHKAAAAAALLGAPLGAPLATAHAQDRAGWHAAVAAGTSLPSGHFNDRVNAGGNVMASAQYDFARLPFSLRADLTHDHFGMSSGYLSQFPGVDGGFASVTSGTLSAVWRAPGYGRLEPYALVGGGAYRRHAEVDSPGPTNVFVDPFWGDEVVDVESTQLVDRSRTVTNFGLDTGLGLGYRVGPTTLFAEGHYETAFTSHRTRYAPLMLGVRW
jgi:hypothetical protein